MSSPGHVGHSSQAGACDSMVRSFWGRGWMAGRGRPLAHIALSVLRSGRRFIEDHDLQGTGLRHRGALRRYKMGFATRLHAVYVFADGKHLARHGDWPTIGDQGQTRAVTFYRNGTEIRTYRVKDLVPDSGAMPRSVSHYPWHRPWVFDG